MRNRIGVVLAVVISFVVQSLATAPETPPNFVVIMADDLGYGDLSSFGNTRYKTPNIDQLASEGMRFTDFHSSGAVCSPTRAGLLTGRYQQRAGVEEVIYAAFDRNRHHGLQMHEITFAEILKAAGYATGIFGKWHLGYEEQYNPVHQGFDVFRGYVSGNVDYVRHIDGSGVFDWWHQNELNREEGYSTHLITKHAIEFIREKRDQPFCVYIAHETPHDPYQGPSDEPVRSEGSSNVLWEHREPGHAEKAYAAMMTELDLGVGDVIRTIRDLKLEDNTLVFFFSDNGATGPGSNGELYGMKGTLWEGGHRVPGIAWWPGKIKSGTVSNELVTTLDIAPTMVDLSKAEPSSPIYMDGMSLAGLLIENKPLPRRIIAWKYGDAMSLRDGPWKLVINGGKPNKSWAQYHNWEPSGDGRERVALFNLDDSIAEKVNLADKHPNAVRIMRTYLTGWIASVTAGSTIQPSKPE